MEAQGGIGRPRSVFENWRAFRLVFHYILWLILCAEYGAEAQALGAWLKICGRSVLFFITFRGGFCLQSAAHEGTEAQGYAQRLQKRYVVLSCFHAVSSRDRSALQPRRKERSSAQEDDESTRFASTNKYICG